MKTRETYMGALRDLEVKKDKEMKTIEEKSVKFSILNYSKLRSYLNNA